MKCQCMQFANYNYMQSLYGTRVAKQLKIIRYIPQSKVYEVRVYWDSQGSSSNFFLSEVFLYPYTLQKSSHQSHQLESNSFVIESNFEQKIGDSLNKNNITMKRNDNHVQKCVASWETSANKDILNYDVFMESMQIRSKFEAKKVEIMRNQQISKCQKKRKV